MDYPQPEFYDELYQPEGTPAGEPCQSPFNPYDEVIYNPPLQTPPIGPYADLQSPSQYKTPEHKKTTTFIHEELPLYDRVQQIVEDVVYDPKDVPPANVSPPRLYTLTSPPRPDYFDVIDVGNRPGIEDENFADDLYQSPPRNMQMPAEIQSPYTPPLLQRPDWDLWQSPPSGTAPSPPLPPMPSPMDQYEPLDMENYDLYQSPYMMDEQECPISPPSAFNQPQVEYDINMDYDVPQFDTNMDPMNQFIQDTDVSQAPQQHPEQTRTTTTTRITEEIYYDEVNSMDVSDAAPPGVQMEWDSPPREELPFYEPYVPPSMYRPPTPVTPPNFMDDHLEAGMAFEEEPCFYGTPEPVHRNGDYYDAIENESPEFYQTP